MQSNGDLCVECFFSEAKASQWKLIRFICITWWKRWCCLGFTYLDDHALINNLGGCFEVPVACQPKEILGNVESVVILLYSFSRP